MSPTNLQIAQILESLASLLEIEEASPFRIRAYRNAADSIRSIDDSIAELAAKGADLTELQDVGPGIAKKIGEILEAGHDAFLAKLEADTGPGLLDLLRIPGLGPKRVRLVRDALGVQTPEELLRACEEERVRTVAGFGAKSEETIARRVRRYLERDTPAE